MRRAPMSVGAGIAAVGLLLSACAGSTSADRAAAPYSSAPGLEASSQGNPPGETAVGGPSQAVLVKLCVNNASSAAVGLTLLGGVTADPGSTTCEQVTGPGSASLAGGVSVSGAEIMQFEGDYPELGFASVTLTQPGFGSCLSKSLLGQGAKTEFKDDGLLRYQFVRTTKIGQQPPQVGFTLTLLDSANPAADAQPVKCA